MYSRFIEIQSAASHAMALPSRTIGLQKFKFSFAAKLQLSLGTRADQRQQILKVQKSFSRAMLEMFLSSRFITLAVYGAPTIPLCMDCITFMS
ncbi:hypothetical protein NC653_015515 [Populus alba x Populus x berolinensis]|uniref:Uncharacterized protein n=1 Tax=Populus alba x Populus x berolinensis TaxID=444605 RepID=A0AAD6QKT6_9ROSI|nr:hypothetical protein NC653_015515 [Populus alba x Populus x berolinensis]